MSRRKIRPCFPNNRKPRLGQIGPNSLRKFPDKGTGNPCTNQAGKGKINN
jgi:hypothetical protein